MLSSTKTSFKLVSKIAVTRPPIRVLDTKSKGWHDLSVRVQGGGVQADYEAKLSFDGETYPSNPSLPSCQRLVKKVAGQVVVHLAAEGTPLYQGPNAARIEIIFADNRQTLLIDADDTLWENNIYFERAIARFISFLNHHEFSPEQVREVLNDVERECIVTHGYGLHSFAHALVDTFERLSVQPVTPELHAQIHSFAHTIADHPIENSAEVPETLQYFVPAPSSILVTKGAIAEQTGKVERSGLKHYFAAVEIVAEKDPAAYRVSSKNTNSARDSTWMVGNSPKSDINPALAAGLNAVFVPHGDTWILEHEEVNPARCRHSNVC